MRDVLADVPSAVWVADRTPVAGGDVLLAHGIHQSVLQRVVQDLRTVTTSHNALLTSLRGGLAGELVALQPVATGTRLIDVNALRSGTKLVLMLLLLLVARVAQQFQESPSRAARLEPVHWQPEASGRWARASDAVGPVPDRGIDPSRPAVMARCLDQIARATERMSGLAREINLRNSRF